MNLRVAGAQINVVDNNVNKNLQTIKKAIDFAADEKADILLTPEGSLSGYEYKSGFNFTEIREALQEIVERTSSRKLGLALGTIFQEDDGLNYNQLRFYDRDGNFLGFHSKILNCSPMDTEPQGELKFCATKPLEVFRFSGIIIGGLLCNDMWANPMCTPAPDPHLSQQLARMGAKVIFHAVNGSRDLSEISQVVARNFHESNQRLRAMAGKAWVVAVDNAYPSDMPNSCTGGVISPEGEWFVKLPVQGEQFFVADLEINSIV
jgi:predicted amidohydrolase